MAIQPVYRTGTRSNALARRLVACAQQVAPHIALATLECETYAESVTVVPCRSKAVQVKCGVTLVPGQVYFMVRSKKFTNRWYVATRNVASGEWMCSSREMQICKSVVARVESFIAARKKAA